VRRATAALFERLAATHGRSGLGVGANDVELVLRNLPTLPLRYAAQDAAARRIAQWARDHRAVAQVLHPALPGLRPATPFWAPAAAAPPRGCSAWRLAEGTP
jgi:cystathionine beta-lyase